LVNDAFDSILQRSFHQKAQLLKYIKLSYLNCFN